jgi:hypothetical protein
MSVKIVFDDMTPPPENPKQKTYHNRPSWRLKLLKRALIDLAFRL